MFRADPQFTRHLHLAESRVSRFKHSVMWLPWMNSVLSLGRRRSGVWTVHRLVALLAVLLLGVSGCSDAGASSGRLPDGGTRPPPCDVSTSSCLPCSLDFHCSDASAPFCNVDTFTCVPCLTSDQCTSPTAARCTEAFECAGCQSNDDCQGVPGASICNDQQVCVECTRNRHCPREGGGLFVCDTNQNRCTDLAVGETGGCESCRFNAQCQEDMLCVPMTFGTPEAGIQDVGSFCLPLAVDMGCLHVNPPYRTLLAVEERTFCSVNHMLTTCPAVLAQGQDVVCAVDEDCGLGGVCDVIGDNGRCSYLCRADIECRADGGQCVGGTPSSPGICI